MHIGRLDPTIAIFTLSCFIMSSLGSNSLGDQVQSALRLHKAGDLSDALGQYLLVIPRLPPGEVCSLLNSNAGSIYTTLGNYERALDMFRAAVEADSSNAQAHFNLAVTLSSKFGREDEALKHCIMAVKLNGKHHKAYHLMGNIFQNMGKESHAQRYFQLAESIAHEEMASSAVGKPRRIELPIFEMKLGETKELSDGIVIMKIECVSERPFAVVVSNFATDDECDHIIERAEPHLLQSYVMGSGESEADSLETDTRRSAYRNSKNTWLSADDILTRLQSRISVITGLPATYIRSFSEEMQVVKYDSAGSTFRVHHDSSNFQPRMLTALVYLADVMKSEEAHKTFGETWFPFTGARDRGFDDDITSVQEAIIRAQELERKVIEGELSPDEYSVDNESEACLISSGQPLKVHPTKGKAILFFNHLPSGAIDSSAVHAGLPTPSDSCKWIANYWVQLKMDSLPLL